MQGYVLWKADKSANQYVTINEHAWNLKRLVEMGQVPLIEWQAIHDRKESNEHKCHLGSQLSHANQKDEKIADRSNYGQNEAPYSEYLHYIV